MSNFNQPTPLVYICPICKRNIPKEYIEKHHLIPKSKKGKETILVCIDCGNQVHLLFSIKELKNKYNTLDKLLENDKVQTWAKWVYKKKDFGICMKKKK